MAEDGSTLQTHDQFLVDTLGVSVERKDPHDIKDTLRKTARNAALTGLALVHAASALKAVEQYTAVDEAMKFNALQAYARINDLNLSTKFVDHFLYGNGEPLDITRDFTDMVRGFVKAEDALFPVEGMQAEMSDQDLLKQYIINTFSQVRLGSDKDEKKVFIRTLSTNDSGQEVEVYHSIDELPDLIGQNIRLFQVQELMSDDSFYSLGNFTTSVEGQLQFTDDGQVTLSNAQFSVFDRYDWKRGMGLNAQTSVEDIIQGSSLE